jgi:branched-chain amino acid transport system permease protein
MASLVGINIDRVISVTFIIGSLLAAAAGVMIAMYYGLVNFFIGYVAGIKAFTAAVLGGIGNIAGAVLGGFILGLVESLGASYLSSEYKDAFAFLILIIVLLFRPTGLMCERAPKKPYLVILCGNGSKRKKFCLSRSGSASWPGR